MKKLLILVLLLALSGCAFNTTVYTSNIVSMSAEAMANHVIVERHLYQNLDVFTDDEREFLSNTSDRIIAIRDKIASIYYTNGMDGLKQGGELLIQYKQLKSYYMIAVTVVEAKLIQLSPEAIPDIQRQILLVKGIDKNIELLLLAEDNNAKAVEAIINVLSIVARLTVTAI